MDTPTQQITPEPATNAGPDCALPTGSDPNACNGYDLAFIEWFRRHGWQIHTFAGQIDVWTHGDATCPYTVTRGMIERLEWNGRIERIFPPHAAVLDYVWAASDQNNRGDQRPAGVTQSIR